MTSVKGPGRTPGLFYFTPETGSVRMRPWLVLTIAMVLASTALTEAVRAQIPAETVPTKEYKPGQGIKLAENGWGDVNFRFTTYLRYLNQGAIDDSYQDSFGTTQSIDKRQDIQLNKMNIYFFGWFLDKKFRYLGYVWTSNASQGLGAQVVVAGNMNYRFNPHFNLGGGIGALPGTRTVEGNWPHWMSVDQRQIADDYFRPSYTTGIWVSGDVTDNSTYTVMLGNNMSQLGIDAGQLDNKLETVSAVLAWMPTTGEFGRGFGDFEFHEKVATRMGAHYTQSVEDSQSQPSTEAPENSQIRISDGNIVFTPDLFGPGITIDELQVRMVAIDAGVKHRGLSLETEFYWRWVTDFFGSDVGQLPFDTLDDSGLQLMASGMIRRDMLQAYLGTSMVFGEYGDPSDVRVGINWFPWTNKAVRWNNEVVFLDESPVGNLTAPYPVGANGTVFNSNFEVSF
jgi:hypothetical protein